MADCLAARFAAQEEQIRLLAREITTLQDGINRDLGPAGDAGVSSQLEELRSENEKLKYRLLHLRRGLRLELELEPAKSSQPGGECGKAAGGNVVRGGQTNNKAAAKKVMNN